MDERKKYENDKEWGSTALELGVIGGIGMGVGATLLRGNASSAMNGGGRAVKRIAGNVDRYLERSVFKRNPLGRFVYKTVKKVPGQSTKLQKELANEIEPLMLNRAAIDAQVKRDRQEAVLKELADAHVQGRSPQPAQDIFNRRSTTKQYEAQAGEAWRNGSQSPYVHSSAKQSTKKETRSTSGGKKNLMDEGVGAAVAGLGFGAGLTAFHALDKRLIGEDKQKDRSYEAAGSFIGGNEMDKRAGTASDIYNGVGEFGKKIPNAVANGIGFTGVTLGTASLLEKVRADARKKAGNDQPQVVVIEQDTGGKKRKKNDTLQSVHVLSQSHPGNFMMTQQASVFGHGVEKVAANPFPGLLDKVKENAQPFISDLKGHAPERQHLLGRLKNHNYETQALGEFTDMDIQKASEPFERVFEHGKAREKGLGELANQLKASDQRAHDDLYERMAKARLATGGVIAGGAGLIGLANKDKEAQR